MKLACKNCGADLKYNIKDKMLYCSHCSQSAPVLDYKYGDSKIDTKIYTCSSCGAKLNTVNEMIINKCNFCGSNNFVTTDSTINLSNVKILPFKYDKDYLLDKFTEHISKNRFSNSSFFSRENIIDTVGLYIPVRLKKYKLNYSSEGIFFTENGDDLEKKHFSQNSNYDVEICFDKLKSMPDELFNSLLGYNFESGVEFSPYYLLGFATSLDNESFVIKHDKAMHKIHNALKEYLNLKFFTKSDFSDTHEIINDSVSIMKQRFSYGELANITNHPIK